MHHAITPAATIACGHCGREKPGSAFRAPRRPGKRPPKCWVCRYLDARTPRGRLTALPRGPFRRGAPVTHSERGDGRLTRSCGKCGAEKPLAEFYLHHSRGRRTSPCRACIRAAMRRYYAANREKAIASHRRWAAQEDPEQRRARFRRCRRRRQREHAIRCRTTRLRVLGVLELAETCADCGGRAADLHHETYGDVCALVSLCRRCHMARHFRHWRRHGGGPVKYPWEIEQEAEV